MFYYNPLNLIYILLAIILLMVIRWGVKRYLKIKREYSDILVGNAQSKGDRREQEDSFSTIK